MTNIKDYIKLNLKNKLMESTINTIDEAAKGLGDLPEDIALFKLDLQSNE